MKARILLVAALAAVISAAIADDRETYNRRAAETDLAAFRTLDLNRDGVLALDEVLHDLNFAPRFHDMDIDRDGFVTMAELRRYLDQSYGVVVTQTGQLVIPLSPAR